METQAYTFELKNDLTELRSLEQHLFNLAGLANLSDKSILRINVCLDELFTNIVSYGFEDDSEHVIKFAVRVEDNLLIIEIEDDGTPFNPLEKIDPEFPANVESAKIGGLGILIIRKLIDSIGYVRKQGKNKLTMHKKIQEGDQKS